MKAKEMLNKMFTNSDISGVQFYECGKPVKAYGMGCIESAVANFGGRKVASFEIRCINDNHYLRFNIYPEEG